MESRRHIATPPTTTAQSPTSVIPISGGFPDPDLNTVKDKVYELIAALFRAP